MFLFALPNIIFAVGFFLLGIDGYRKGDIGEYVICLVSVLLFISLAIYFMRNLFYRGPVINLLDRDAQIKNRIFPYNEIQSFRFSHDWPAWDNLYNFRTLIINMKDNNQYLFSLWDVDVDEDGAINYLKECGVKTHKLPEQSNRSFWLLISFIVLFFVVFAALTIIG